ncbi:MAG: radical SAM protein [Candidatus Omnitrophica bacterium]|nr:radical SAM protein [Candidatus Omnitrophota bacterium]
MTDMLFVQNYYEQNIGIMYISALLKKHGFTTDVAIGSKKDIIRKTIKNPPRVIGFYCTTGFHHKNIAIAVEIKKLLGNRIRTILGGPHPTFIPEAIENEGIDIICRGEGEYAVLELIESLNAGRDYTGIKNLIVKKDGKIYKNELRPLCDMDALPHPDRELYRDIESIYRNKRQEVMIGRGCCFDCAFCSNHAFKELYKGKGVYTKCRTISNVIDELALIKNKFNPSCFFFHDDVFLAKKSYFSEFLKIYNEKIRLPYACLVRADQMTEDYAKLLKETGCYLVSFGIESGNSRLRNMLLNKNVSDDSIVKCASLFHKHRISFMTFNMVGFPGETLRETLDTVDINVRIRPNWAWFSIYQPLPSTKLAQFALDKGYISSIDVLARDATFHKSSIILKNHPEGKKILRLKNSANLMIKFPFLKGFINKIVINMPFDGLYNLIDNLLYFILYYSKLTYRQSGIEAIRSLYWISRNMKNQEC